MATSACADDAERQERAAFLKDFLGDGSRTTVQFQSHPCGDNNTTDEDDLETNFYKHVAVGAELEFGEIAVGEEALAKMSEEQPMHKKMYHVSAVIFHYTKYCFSFTLFLLVGPFLAFVWAILLSVSKFIVSWVFYPFIKILTILCRPCRSIMRITLWPAAAAAEIASRCFPVWNFSLWSVVKPEDKSNKDNNNSSINNTVNNKKKTKKKKEPKYGKDTMDESEAEAEVNV